MTLKDIIIEKQKKMSMRDVFNAIPDLEEWITGCILKNNEWTIPCDKGCDLEDETLPMGYEDIFRDWAVSEGLTVNYAYDNNGRRALVLTVEK